MRHRLSLWGLVGAWILANPILGWAEIALTTTTVFVKNQAAELTDDLKQQVPSVAGLALDTQTTPGVTTIHVMRQTGEFSDAERTAIQAVVQAYAPHPAPIDADAELETAITSVDTTSILDPAAKQAIEAIKNALLGKTSKGKVKARTP